MESLAEARSNRGGATGGRDARPADVRVGVIDEIVSRIDPPALDANWRRTRCVIARLELRSLNPLVLAWNLARGIRLALGFLVAMDLERY